MRALIVAWAAACVGDVSAGQGSSIDIAVAEGRPVAAAVLELENRYGWTITYEDPPYESPGDVEDVTRTVSKNPEQKNRVLVPRFRPFTFRYQGAVQPHDVLSAMLRDYHLTGSGDEFHLMQTGSVFHVVPISSANAQGVPTPRQSRLDVAVTMEDGERTALEAVEAILRQVRLVSGIQVLPGTMPINFLAQKRGRIEAMEEPARDVLLRVLAETGSKLSWRLLCDPGATKRCAFNLHFVPTSESCASSRGAVPALFPCGRDDGSRPGGRGP